MKVDLEMFSLSPADGNQALLRLLALPWILRAFSAEEDELARHSSLSPSLSLIPPIHSGDERCVT